MSGSRIGVVLPALRNTGVSVLLATSLIDSLVKGVLSPKRKIVSPNYRPEANFAIRRTQRRRQGKDGMTTEKDTLRLVHVASQKKLLPRSYVVVLVTTGAKRPVKIRIAEEWDSGRTWTTASVVIDVFMNRPFNFIVLNLTNTQLSLTKLQGISTAMRFPSGIIHNNFVEPSLWISNPQIGKGV